MIELLKLADEPQLRAHVQRHGAENGDRGFWFHPMRGADIEAVMQAALVPDAWVDDPASHLGWQRVWGYRAMQGRLRGHASLTCTPITPHRATLIVGVETPVRRMGIALELLEAAIDWAKAQPSIDWLDAFAFANNAAAPRLVQAFGFSQIGCTPDALRWIAPSGIEHSTEQMQFTLRLPSRAQPLFGSSEPVLDGEIDSASFTARGASPEPRPSPIRAPD